MVLGARLKILATDLILAASRLISMTVACSLVFNGCMIFHPNILLS
jgi:hypothetical protein